MMKVQFQVSANGYNRLLKGEEVDIFENDPITIICDQEEVEIKRGEVGSNVRAIIKMRPKTRQGTGPK